MATSLQRQLSALADPSSSLLVPDRKRASIIFTASEAAKYDRETFYQIGLEGLKELDGLNPRLFGKYFDSVLFDESSKNVERAVMSGDVNKELDGVIEEFLIALSPYMMLKAPLKCMEWLVHRFHVEKFNIEAMLACILPYYDTKTFALVIKVLEVERAKNHQQWMWLVPSIQTGLPVTKVALFGNGTSVFVQWLFRTLENFLKVHEEHPENMGTFFAFLSSTIIGILNKFKENLTNSAKNARIRVVTTMISTRTQQLLQAMRDDESLRQIENLHSTVYMIITMLMILRKEAPDIAGIFEGTQVMLLLLKTCTPELMESAILVVNLIASVNSWGGLPLEDDVSQLNVLEGMMKLSNRVDIYCAASLLLKTLFVRKLCPASRVWEFVGSIHMSPHQRANLLRDAFLSDPMNERNKKGKEKKMLADRLRLCHFLGDFERQFPLEFGLAVDSDPEFASKIADLATKSELSGLTTHGDDELRRSGLKKLLAKAKRVCSKGKVLGKNWKKDKNNFAKQIVERFDDEDVGTIEIILKQKVLLMRRMFNVKTLVNGYLKILKKRPSAKCTRLAIKRLCRVALILKPKHKVLSGKIMTATVPYLFPMQSSDIKLTKALLSTKFACQHSFFKGFSKVLENGDVGANQICQLAYETMQRVPPQLSSSHWLEEYHRSNNVFHAFLATVTMKNQEDVRNILSDVEKVTLNCHMTYPVDAEKIHKQLKLMRKSQQLSLELLFTSISKIDISDEDLILPIFTYALICSERHENRDTCANFLHTLLHKSFKRSSSLLEFWMHMIIEHGMEPNVQKAEYLLVRSLQFLASIFDKLAVTVAEDAEEKSKPEVKALRPLAEEIISSPARNTRRSVKGPIVPLELPLTPRQTRSKQDSTESDSSSRSRKAEEYKKEASDLVELLLTQCVQHESVMVRNWGLECLKMLLEWRHLEAVWRDLIVYVLRFRAAIESDRMQVAAAVSRLLSEKASTKLHERFIQIGTDEEKLELIRIGFLELCGGVTASVFEKLTPHVSNLIQEDPASPILAAYLNTYDGSVSDPDLIRECLRHRETAKKILSKLTPSTFEKMDLSSKKALFRIMVDTSSVSDIAEVRVSIARTLRKWILDTAIIEAELDVCLALQKKQSNSSAANQTRRKSVSFNLTEEGKLDTTVDWVRRTQTVLEFVQSGKRLSRKTKLIQPLFKILKICIEMEEQTPVEYLKQLMLTSLTIACEDEEHNEDIQSNLSDWVHFQVDSVIDCLRISRNPQTHHHALILLNYAAKRFPEQVLHGIMSLFTFMGNSILRQDDSYSTQLIQQTVATIIPTLTTLSGARQYSRSLVSAGIYRVFTSAVQDIPVHRRVPIFTSLVDVLDPVESMWQMCFIIIENALMGQSQNKRSVLKSDLELTKDILSQFKPDIILATFDKMYMYIMELPVYDKKRNEDFAKCQAVQGAWSKSVIDLSRKHSLREAQLLINFCLDLIGRTIAKFEDLEKDPLDFESLLEKCLSFSRTVATLSDDKTWRQIANRNFEVIEKINVALESTDFVKTVGLILGKEDVGIKRKILDILNQRLIQKFEWFDNPASLADILPALVSCCEMEVGDQGDLVSLIQTAFLSLKLLARNLALKLPEAFVPVFETSYANARNKNPLLAASALLCLSELFCLKTLILPRLNEVTKSILKSFKKAAAIEVSSDAEDENVENGEKTDGSNMGAYLLIASGVTALSKFMESLGAFAGTTFLSKALIAVLSIHPGFFGEGEKADNRRRVFDQKLKGLTKTIAAKIPLRNSLTSIKKVFFKLIHNPQSLVVVVKLLKDTLVATEKGEFNTLLPSLFDTFLNDLLVYRDSVSAETNNVKDVQLVEDEVVEALVTGVVLKLAEGTFRPFYHRVFDWATDSLPRKITFYRFSVFAAERLKSLFVTFAGYVIAKAGESLTEDLELTRAILNFFYHIFSNDREGFVTIERFNLLMKPLVDLVESEWVISGQIPIADLNSTIIQLAVATNDLNRWQHLVEDLAAKSQHKDSRVRLFTIAALEAIANELEKDFLPLLPPAVPFLADLLGDDDETVEAETKKMLVKLEAIVGEPLQPYFSA